MSLYSSEHEPDPAARWRTANSGVPAGLALLDCGSTYDLAVGYAEFREHTGLDHAELISEFVVAAPLPAYPDVLSEHDRRWPTVNPEALWHPAFWLPAEVWVRQVRDDLEEPDPVWVVRVCLELEAAGLYRSDRGWRDVLYDVGLRVEDEADLVRIREWQQGRDDPALDAIDLSARLVRIPDDQGTGDQGTGDQGTGDQGTGDQEDWAGAAAAGLIGDLLGRAWAVHADEFLGWIVEAESGEPVRQRAETQASLGPGVFAGAVAPGVDPGTEFWSWFSDIVDDLGLSDEALLSGPITAAKPWLTATRAHYWSSIDALAAAAERAAAG
ncbi:hypothetical protein [Microlunatus speluncae]|uniref:hypothetical protein n=1 Tax=Microlunatus speluncae TaxID=2594267 RepID=UPI0012665FF3|nr:hypothetical protein [Microlunatus speluncae]